MKKYPRALDRIKNTTKKVISTHVYLNIAIFVRRLNEA